MGVSFHDEVLSFEGTESRCNVSSSVDADTSFPRRVKPEQRLAYEVETGKIVS